MRRVLLRECVRARLGRDARTPQPRAVTGRLLLPLSRHQDQCIEVLYDGGQEDGTAANVNGAAQLLPDGPK